MMTWRTVLPVRCTLNLMCNSLMDYVPTCFYFSNDQQSSKGLGRQMHFLRPIKSNHYFLYMRKWFIKLFACLVQEKNICRVFVCFFENTYHCNSKNWFGNRIIISVLAPSVSLVDFLQCSPLIGCRKNPRHCSLYNVQCKSGSFQYDISDLRRAPVSVFIVQIAAVEHLKRVTVRIFTN
jgi:hypothetical protein